MTKKAPLTKGLVQGKGTPPKTPPPPAKSVMPKGTSLTGASLERPALGFNANFAVGGAGSFGGGTGVVSLLNAAVAPTSDPSGGGIIYTSSGALYYRGSSGTITKIAEA